MNPYAQLIGKLQEAGLVGDMSQMPSPTPAMQRAAVPARVAPVEMLTEEDILNAASQDPRNVAPLIAPPAKTPYGILNYPGQEFGEVSRFRHPVDKETSKQVKKIKDKEVDARNAKKRANEEEFYKKIEAERQDR